MRSPWLPLLFTFRRTLFGDGFVVEVKASNGRALCVHEDDETVWMYGVNPGGMAAFGRDAVEAREAFADAFTKILKDIVLKSVSFEDFERMVHDFFEQTNDGFEQDWAEAVQTVKMGGVAPDGLPLIKADSVRSVVVEVKGADAYKPADNDSELTSSLASAV